jgi:hypothetical protein
MNPERGKWRTGNIGIGAEKSSVDNWRCRPRFFKMLSRKRVAAIIKKQDKLTYLIISCGKKKKYQNPGSK